MNRIRKAAIGGALAVALAGAAGAGLLSATANAQTSGGATAPATGAAPQGSSFDPTKGGHVGTNGVKEELLTGDTAAKVTAAALAAVPGGTVQRVETDAEGDVYEAHMLKADGTPVTVKFDAAFKVTATETGGPGGHGGGPRTGAKPAA